VKPAHTQGAKGKYAESKVSLKNGVEDKVVHDSCESVIAAERDGVHGNQVVKRIELASNVIAASGT